jgi:flavin reductase (DIM6/NTAB) family NADH-FMN oxidoreductase RutF
MTKASMGCFVTQHPLLSRLLYPNPVCLLSVSERAANNKGAPEDNSSAVDPASDKARKNVMTISWLTCINNQGLFFCSINKRRHTASMLQIGRSFVLNVPVKGMEKLVLAIGGCTGKTQDKLSTLDLQTCHPGWIEAESKQGGEEEELVAIRACVAHLVCRVESIQEEAGHLLVRAQLKQAWVRKDYWDGKTFVAQREDVPPYLTFLGSQRFGYVLAGNLSPAVAYEKNKTQTSTPEETLRKRQRTGENDNID